MGRASARKAEKRATRLRPEISGVLERAEAYAETCETTFGGSCWELMDARMQRGRDEEWPAWCPMPAGAVYAMARSMRDTQFGDRVFHNLTPMLHTLWLWRYGRGVYRFDDDMAAALLDTPLSSGLPVEVLTRLPEWCPLIVAPTCEGWPEEVAGVFVCHSWNAEAKRREMRLVYLPSEPDVPLISIVPLNFDTLGEALDAWRVHAVSDQRVARYDREAVEDQLDRSVELAKRAIGLVLYLSAENTELRALDDPGRPVAQPERPTVAKRPREILVGYRSGPLLARRRREIQSGRGAGGGVEPHLRRAHWHHYWVGGAEDPGRHLELRWLSPTLVGGRPVRPRVRDVGAAPVD